MVFDKQHLSLFVALAFLLVYSNAVPTDLRNEKNVERLRGDLHQFIEMILSCITNSRMATSQVDQSQVNKFKQVSNSLQEDLGARSSETKDLHDNMRKHGLNEMVLNEGDDSNEGPYYANNSKETTETSGEVTSQGYSDENDHQKEFDLPEGVGHSFTPRPGTMDTSDTGSTEKTAMMSTISSNYQPRNFGMPQSESKEDSTNRPFRSQQPGGQSRENFRGRKYNGDENTSTSSNESKDDIQVRNHIQETPRYASGSSVSPYDALHIYGIQTNGPINKIVFEGGEHHPPRPLTVRESNHLKEFIRMVLKTNEMNSPMATFPNNEEDIAPRSGFGGNQGKKSPWGNKPVPLELV